MSKKRDRSATPISVTATASQWLHLLLVAGSGRQTLTECEGSTLNSIQVRELLREADGAFAAINRGMQAADHIERQSQKGE